MPSILEELYESEPKPAIQTATPTLGASFKMTATATVIRGNPDNIDADDLLQAMKEFDSIYRNSKKVGERIKSQGLQLEDKKKFILWVKIQIYIL